MNLEITSHLDGVEDKIDSFIFSITGLHCKERTVGEKYSLSLGDIEVGFYKNRHPEIDNFRVSSYLKMLHIISEFMLSGAEFEIWCFSQKLNENS